MNGQESMAKIPKPSPVELFPSDFFPAEALKSQEPELENEESPRSLQPPKSSKNNNNNPFKHLPNLFGRKRRDITTPPAAASSPSSSSSSASSSARQV